MKDPARVFGEVADEYDRVRPPYPDALFDDVLDYGLGDGRALEVGAGTGRATVELAARGVPVVAVEPDDAMAAVLDRRVARFPQVRVVRSSFEDFRPDERFGLLLSAEAWHWTVPATRWTLAADALGDGAAFAWCWNNERVADSGLRTAMIEVFARYAPSVVITDDLVTPDDVWERWPGAELAGVEAFAEVTSRHYRSLRTTSAADYLALARTRSQFRTLPPQTGRTLMEALTALFGDEVQLDFHSTLLLARRRPR